MSDHTQAALHRHLRDGATDERVGRRYRITRTLHTDVVLDEGDVADMDRERIGEEDWALIVAAGLPTGAWQRAGDWIEELPSARPALAAVPSEEDEDVPPSAPGGVCENCLQPIDGRSGLCSGCANGYEPDWSSKGEA